MTEGRWRPTFVEITSQMWPRAGTRIQQIEDVSFAPKLRDDSTYLRSLVASKSAVFFAAKLENDLVGYLAADRLEKFIDVPGVGSDVHYGHSDTLYVASIAVLPFVATTRCRNVAFK